MGGPAGCYFVSMACFYDQHIPYAEGHADGETSEDFPYSDHTEPIHGLKENNIFKDDRRGEERRARCGKEREKRRGNLKLTL